MFEYLHFFSYAFDGLRYAVTNHRSFLIQVLSGSLAIMAGFLFSISRIEWLILVVSIGGVLTAELFNTAVESILDYMEKKHNLNVRIAKDVAAGGVLVTALVSTVVGLLIFGPYLVDLFV
ncbi:diacylglycerol kinase family protein [candidate division WWE3 bacterium]|uniref:Diacylglycerol kinase family protein n=1 Tax=candidate division WWE3 bacterium TaxID=2053526 RepID=A0A955LGQ5_UNCKA|nr:diacylglycerol kinase family protein [candidate division WWE3 bacterium]